MFLHCYVSSLLLRSIDFLYNRIQGIREQNDPQAPEDVYDTDFLDRCAIQALPSETEDAWNVEPVVAIEKKALQVKRNANLGNEIENNDEILRGAFPDLFFLEGLFPTKGTMPTSFIKHLFSQLNRSFAKNTGLLFFLENQQRRHAAMKGVRVAAKEVKGSFKTFMKTVNDPRFNALAAKLETGTADPAEEKKFLQLAQNCMNVAGGKVTWSQSARIAVLPKLFSLQYYTGLPSYFFTLAPPDHESKWVMRVSHKFGYDGVMIPISSQIPKATHRDVMLACREDPVACSDLFFKIMYAWHDAVWGLKSAESTRYAAPTVISRRGCAFGIPISHSDVYEVSGRGSLHVHMSGRTDLTPEMLYERVDDAELVAKIRNVIDSIISTHLPNAFHNKHLTRQECNEIRQTGILVILYLFIHSFLY